MSSPSIDALFSDDVSYKNNKINFIEKLTMMGVSPINL